MKRGIISLTNLELGFLKNLVDENDLSEDDFFSKLAPDSKQSPDADSSTEIIIFFNQEQAEEVLDLLPVPNQSNDQELKTIRQKIATFLQSSS